MSKVQTITEYHASGKELQAEVIRVLGRKMNPGYLLNIQNGNQMNSKLGPIIDKYRARKMRAKHPATTA